MINIEYCWTNLMDNHNSSGNKPPVCDYEGSDYQTRFWEKGGRAYEDGCEERALKRLLPKSGGLMLEVGAGAGRNTLRYKGFRRIVLLDYSKTQLQQARAKLGNDDRFIYVVSDIYKLPFIENLFDSATMIRVLHHMADAPLALKQIRSTLHSSSTFILEFANKRNIKSILRYALRKQSWNPFFWQPVEFTTLNFNFHPRSIRKLLESLDFHIEKVLTVSHFRIGWLKRNIPVSLLVWMDSILQWTGMLFQLSPSVFVLARLDGKVQGVNAEMDVSKYFKCPNCNHYPLEGNSGNMICPACGKKWPIEDGIFNFKD